MMNVDPVEDAEVRTALARGLAARLRDATEAADRLADFSFEERWDRALPTSLPDGDEAGVAHDFVLRAFAGAADPLNYRLLDMVGRSSTGVTITDLMSETQLTRLALIERVHGLIQLGLLARDLQADTVRPTPAGLGMTELIGGLQIEVAEWLGKRRRR